jgi:hypothetical protein
MQTIKAGQRSLWGSSLLRAVPAQDILRVRGSRIEFVHSVTVCFLRQAKLDLDHGQKWKDEPRSYIIAKFTYT